MPAMRHDAYGLPLSTGSSPALETYDRAVEGLLSWDSRALDLFRTATAHDVGPCTRTPFWSAIPPRRIFSSAMSKG